MENHPLSYWVNTINIAVELNAFTENSNALCSYLSLTVPSVKLPGLVFLQSSSPHAADAYAQLWALSFNAHPATQENQD